MTAELNGAAPATDAPPAPSPPPPDSAELSRLGDRIATMAASINAAMYQMLVLIAQFDRHRGWQSPGRASCADWLVWRTGVTIGTAREKVRIAWALEHLPKTSREMEAGLLSYTKVRALTRVATPENEDVLLEYAQAGSAAKLEQIMRGLRQFSRNGELTTEEIRHRCRKLSMFIDRDGMYMLNARLEPEVGAALMRAIEAAEDALFRNEGPDARPEPRQRRADAAGLVAERALAAGFGDAGTPATSGARAERYQVVVHTELATLKRDGEPGRSELDGVRVCAETSRRMACDAAVVPMLHGGDGSVLNVGRKTRTIPPHIRRALDERDRGCRFPGCASRFTEAHHVKHWADGGVTSLRNTLLLCRRHHRVVHEGQVRLCVNPEGKAAFFTREGKVLASAPPMVKGPPPELQPAPPEPFGRLSNGAARFLDWAVPWELEVAVREALDPDGE